MGVYLQKADGSALANNAVTLSIFRNPDASGVQGLNVLDSGTTDSSGYFYTEVYAYNTPDFENDFELQATPNDGSAPLLFDFTSEYGPDSPDITTVPEGSKIRASIGLVDSVPAGQQPAPTAPDAGIAATVAADAEPNEETAEYVAADDVTTQAQYSQSSSAGSCGRTQNVLWLPTGRYRYPYVPTKYYKTTSRTNMTWKLARSNETSMQVATEIKGKFGTGGFLYSRNNKASVNYEYTAGYNAQGVYKIKVQFQQQQQACQNSSPMYSPITKIDSYRWAPIGPYSLGNKPKAVSDTFACGGKGAEFVDQIGGKVTVAQSSEVNLRGFFGIKGVSLDAYQKDRDEQSLTITPKAGTVAKICGYDKAPQYAKLVKEMVY